MCSSLSNSVSVRDFLLCASRTAAVLAIVFSFAQAVEAEELHGISSPIEPTTKLSDVVPLRVLDSFTLPDQPPPRTRIATRETLDWRPGSPNSSAKTNEEADGGYELELIEAGPSLAPPSKQEIKSVVQSRSKKTIKNVPSRPSPEDRKVANLPTTPSIKESFEKSTSEQKTPPLETKPQKEAPTRKELSLSGSEPPTPLPRNLKMLRSRLRTVLSYYYRQPLNNVEHDPWEVMHSMLSYELYSKVLEGGPRGKPITAVGFLCYNKPSERKKLLYINQAGEIDARVGVGLQGHKGQLLAMLAQCNVSPEYPIRVEGKEYKIKDFIRSEQHTCYARTELTFKLIGLGHYLDSNSKWVNTQGEEWDIPRLIREERTQPIRGAACGGTHRLSGLSLAYMRREARGEPIDGEYLEARNFVRNYQQYAFRLQNRDGSFSTEWFRGRGAEEDIERRIRTSGHTLEWLIYSLPDEQLRSNNVVRGVTYLTNLMANYGKQEWHKGSLAHAIHALVLYDKRVFQPHDGIDEDAGSIVSTVNPNSNKYRGYSTYRGVIRGGSQPKQEETRFGLFGGSRR